MFQMFPGQIANNVSVSCAKLLGVDALVTLVTDLFAALVKLHTLPR
jgi:hypothetical protein